MDFTSLFIAILVLLAIKTGQWLIVAALVLLLLFISRSKILNLATVAGIAIGSAVLFGNNVPDWFVLVGLFIILIAASRTDAGLSMGQEAYYPGGGEMR